MLANGVCGVVAPVRVAEALRAAPDGPVQVLHRSTSAVYLDLAGRCVGVLTPEAVAVPCGLRLGDAVGSTGEMSGFSAAALLADAGERAYVGRGILHLSDTPLSVRRFVDVRVPRIALSGIPRQPVSPADVVAQSPRTAAAGLTVSDLLASSGLRLGPRPSREAIHTLVGRGEGLTPLGDDVLAGWLVALAALGRLDAATADLVRSVLPRTTLLSATLLDCALHGEAIPEVAAYLATVGTAAEPAAVAALLEVGHTSGAGLWWGAAHAIHTAVAEERAA